MAKIDQIFTHIEKSIKDIIQHNTPDLKRYRRYTGAGKYKYAIEMMDTNSTLLIEIEKNSDNISWD